MTRLVALPDGRTLVVHGRVGEESWHFEIEGVKGSEVVGRPLSSTLAAALGYRVGREEWPRWVDDLAEDIAAHAATGDGPPETTPAR